MAFVLDASVVLAWLLPDEHSEAAQSIMGRLVLERAQAPALIHYDVGNALLQAARRKRIPEALVMEMLELFLELPIALQSPDAASTAASSEISRRHGLTHYDASYVELASRHRVRLATLDEALRRAARAEGVEILS